MNGNVECFRSILHLWINIFMSYFMWECCCDVHALDRLVVFLLIIFYPLHFTILLCLFCYYKDCMLILLSLETWLLYTSIYKHELFSQCWTMLSIPIQLSQPSNVTQLTPPLPSSSVTAWQAQESQRRQAQGWWGGSWHEHQEHHHCSHADDADAVCCSLYMGHQQCLQ